MDRNRRTYATSAQPLHTPHVLLPLSAVIRIPGFRDYDSSMASVLSLRRAAGYPIPDVYLRVVGQVEDIRHSHNEPLVAEIERLQMTQGVRFLGDEEDFSYTASL